ncbi:MAG: hypothetical protein H7178_09945 [Chitinophagaceae bacterium]|nr:hypothetical protein [Chitinophagaceae bacterium]
MELKDKIHALVEACNNEDDLRDAFVFLKGSSEKNDWWNQLSEQQQQITKASLQQSANGQTISHHEMQERIWSKFGK